nr:putative ferric-chelate reductase 1 homolog [Dermacentor andersoni]
MTRCAHTGWAPEDPCAAFETSSASQSRSESDNSAVMEDDGDEAKLAVTLLPDNRSAEVVLEGSFRGFVIQARKSNERGSLVLGEFKPGSDDSTRTHTCSGHENAVISGADGSAKATATWEAPSDWTGAVVFRALVMRNREATPHYVVSDPVVLGKKAPRMPQSAERLREVESQQADEQPRTIDSPIISVDKSNDEVKAVEALAKEDENHEGNEEPQGGMDEMQKACGATKGCFGFPEGCIAKGSCQMLVSYVAEEEGYHFELTGPADAERMWIAAGISESAKMELTSVVECIRSGEKILIRESWNQEGTVNTLLETPTAGITFGSHAMTDGVLKCSWKRKANTTVQGKTFDLAKSKYFVLLAKGDITDTDAKTYHKHRIASKETLSFGEKRLAKSGSDRNPLILVHGNMMILAWLYLVSLAIMIARHFKSSWEGSMILGDKVWFILHRCLMGTAVISVLISVSVIFYTSGGWNYSGNLHPILGITAVVLGCFQPIMASFRCHPEEQNRYIFNWMHWGNGNTAHIFAVTTIVFATGLKKANLGGSKWFLPVLALHVTFYVVVQLALQIHKSMTLSSATSSL